MKISVLGSGAWGTALATMLAGEEDDVLLWGRDEAVVESINEKRENPVYLPGIQLSKKLKATTDIKAVSRADILLCVTPTQSFSGIADQIDGSVLPETRFVLCAKGIDRNSGDMLHTIAARHFGEERVFALSGPSFASDVARGLPTAVSLAGHELEAARAVSGHLARHRFRIYASDDVVGLEVGGALKNVLALAVGVARGLELGASAEAALIARGFGEINRIAKSVGARPETLAGLSGLGDLVLSCSSPQSRNFSYGIALAKNEDLTNRPLAEGVFTADVALKLAQKNGVDVPIIESVVHILDKDIMPMDAVNRLLSRTLRTE